ncbi:uncharacterized protein LOC124955262 [Vespa velutina]|uniref:uncharacterized protein LOC124955262 n=1 Tax=Vespa velutina TaxID=202808 RepID=UPI001FB48FEC|nr:uncharacterized protein LOC124955262 [Vespa velutina]
MDTFEHPYYKLNKRLLVLIGQWPYQNLNDRFFRRCIVNIAIYSFFITQIGVIYEYRNDIDMILDIIPSLTVGLVIIIKYYTYQIQRKNIQNLMKHTISNWKIWETQEEMDIMHKFASEGRFLTLFYIIYVSSSEIMFLILPFYPRLMDIIVPLNESRPLRALITAYYFVDEEEYFYSIYFHMSIVIIIGITVIIASDSLFLVFNSHICGLFSAIGFRLEHLFKDPIDSGRSFNSRARKMCFDNVVHSIKNHKRALEFADLIETSYSVSLMIQTFMGMIGVSVSLFQVLMLLDNKTEALRFVISGTGQFVHLMCICYPGQRIIDYSTEIRFNAYNGLWYEAPIEVHRLMLLIIRRSTEPCYLTGGKIFVFCLETYAKVHEFKNPTFLYYVQLTNNNFSFLRSSKLPALTSCFLITQIGVIYEYTSDIDIILDSIPALSVSLLVIIKYYTYQIQRKNIQNLLKHTISNWKIWKTQEEMDIMHKFANEGRFLTLFYIIYISSSEIMFLILPFYPRLMDIIVPLNESRPLRALITAYYFVDEEEYFYSIYFHMSIVIIIGITVIIASDSLFLVFNSHICGLFTAIRFRLEHLFIDSIDSGHSFDSRARKICFDNVVHSIKNHKRALEFADLIETSYSVSLMIQAFMGMIGLSVSLFQVLMLLDNKTEAFRFVISGTAQYVHLLCICYPGQRMIDYSTEIRFNAYNGLWYEAPIEVHRLMLLIIRRSIEPCYLTAGKTFVFCLETYAKIVQTSGSYFMVILSTH